ncbi:hypothetical protein LQW54_000463 [Pestalotiopsis sp. IQ-011]
MLMKTYITAVALAATVIAAPVPESCTGTSARGLGIFACEPASKREAAPEPAPEACTGTAARGLGIFACTESESKREQAPEKRTGMGIIRDAVEKRTGMGIVTLGTDEA